MKLPRVEPGQEITAEAWNSVVSAINGTLDCSIKRGKLERQPDTLVLRLVQLKTDWSREAAPFISHFVWKATANPYVNGRLNEQITIDVYAPGATAHPSSRYPDNRQLYVVNAGGVWVSLEPGLIDTKCVAGDGVSISENASRREQTITNDGVLKIADKNDSSNKWIKGNAYLGRGLELRDYMGSIHTDGTPAYDGIGVKTVGVSFVQDVDSTQITPTTSSVQVVTGVSLEGGAIKCTYGYINQVLLPAGTKIVTSIDVTKGGCNGVDIR